MKTYVVYNQYFEQFKILYVGIDSASAYAELQHGDRPQDNHMEIWDDGMIVGRKQGVYKG